MVRDLSTQWYSDARKWDIHLKNAELFAENKWIEDADVSDLTFIKFLGGEPFMEQDKMITLLRKCNREKLVVHITTNGTLLPNETLHQLLQECEIVYMTLSIDQFGEFNDLLRKGSHWETTMKNMFAMKEHYGKDKTTVHSVTSIYNVNLCVSTYSILFTRKIQSK